MKYSHTAFFEVILPKLTVSSRLSNLLDVNRKKVENLKKFLLLGKKHSETVLELVGILNLCSKISKLKVRLFKIHIYVFLSLATVRVI